MSYSLLTARGGKRRWKKIKDAGVSMFEESLRACSTVADAFPPLKGCVSGILYILEVEKKVNDNRRSSQEQLDKAVDILLKLADRDANGGLSDEMKQNIRDIQPKIEKLVGRFKKIHRKSRLRILGRFLSRPHADEIARCEKELEGALSVFTTIAVMSLDRSLHAMNHSLSSFDNRACKILTDIKQNQKMLIIACAVLF